MIAAHGLIRKLLRELSFLGDLSDHLQRVHNLHLAGFLERIQHRAYDLEAVAYGLGHPAGHLVRRKVNVGVAEALLLRDNLVIRAGFP